MQVLREAWYPASREGTDGPQTGRLMFKLSHAAVGEGGICRRAVVVNEE